MGHTREQAFAVLLCSAASLMPRCIAAGVLIWQMIQVVRIYHSITLFRKSVGDSPNARLKALEKVY